VTLPPPSLSQGTMQQYYQQALSDHSHQHEMFVILLIFEKVTEEVTED